MEPLISIVIPAYNVEKYIDRCIKSVLDQTYNNLQIIIVNDGSTDSTLEKCQKYRDHRIEVYSKQNGGLSDARNYGIQFAEGKYIAFVDSDDWLAKTMISELYDAMTQLQVSLVVCEPFYAYDDHIYSRTTDGLCYSLKKEDALNLLVQDRRFRTNAWNKLYETSLWKDIRFPVGRKYEDVATIYKIYNKLEKIGFLNRSLYYYYQRGDSIVHKFSVSSANDYLTGILERRKYLIELYPNMSRLLDASVIRAVYDIERDVILSGSAIPIQYDKYLWDLAKQYTSIQTIKELPPRIIAELLIHNTSVRLYKKLVPLIDVKLKK